MFLLHRVCADAYVTSIFCYAPLFRIFFTSMVQSKGRLRIWRALEYNCLSSLLALELTCRVWAPQSSGPSGSVLLINGSAWPWFEANWVYLFVTNIFHYFIMFKIQKESNENKLKSNIGYKIYFLADFRLTLVPGQILSKVLYNGTEAGIMCWETKFLNYIVMLSWISIHWLLWETVGVLQLSDRKETHLSPPVSSNSVVG